MSGYMGADSVEGSEYVSVEVSGVLADQTGTFVSGEVKLSPESARYAIWALAKSMGKADEAEAFLTEQWGPNWSEGRS